MEGNCGRKTGATGGVGDCASGWVGSDGGEKWGGDGGGESGCRKDGERERGILAGSEFE